MARHKKKAAAAPKPARPRRRDGPSGEKAAAPEREPVAWARLLENFAKVLPKFVDDIRIVDGQILLTKEVAARFYRWLHDNNLGPPERTLKAFLILSRGGAEPEKRMPRS